MTDYTILKRGRHLCLDDDRALTRGGRAADVVLVQVIGRIEVR